MKNHSLWRFGESGYSGSNLSKYNIICPFCMENGNFETVHHEEKTKPNSSKTLNFDTLKCGNCAGYVLVFWSASEHGNIHDSLVIPQARRTESYPEHWPEEVGIYWVESRRVVEDGNWYTGASSARNALQAALRCHPDWDGNAKRSLIQEIDDFASKGHLPPIMKEWSNEVRLLGNISSHPIPGRDSIEPKDVYDIMEFLEFLLTYLYDLPERINQYKNRNKK
ncbi:DUF4145 domain-containing protein [Candidatus Poribacteria bacterium]|nr:DUF4145 domain-containing protein [Candidatus Poribacteria bacterium]